MSDHARWAIVTLVLAAALAFVLWLVLTDAQQGCPSFKGFDVPRHKFTDRLCLINIGYISNVALKFIYFYAQFDR